MTQNLPADGAGGALADPLHGKPATVIRQRWHLGEDSILAFILGTMIALPLLEIVLRQFSSGIPNAPEFQRHLTLLVGMAGGAIAARESRLLALASSATLFHGRGQFVARILSSSAAAAVTAVLCAASLRFVIEERASGGTLPYGVPRWIVQLALPLGFGVIAVRLLWHSAETWAWRIGSFLIAVAVGVAAAFAPTWLALVGLLVATVLGAPPCSFSTAAMSPSARWRSTIMDS
jgi:TRAP-type C4-dicarboxylate transport system permease small subunit